MNTIAEKIREAVDLFDADDDTNWNKRDGKPSVDLVREMTEDPSITRADIEAAMPGFSRRSNAPKPVNDEEKVVTDGEKELSGENKAAPETQEPEKPSSEAEAPSSEESQPENSQEDIEGDGEAMTGETLLIRGLLMAILLRLPKTMRAMADRYMLDSMADFVASIASTHEDIMVTIELIKSIAEANMEEIPNGMYQDRVAAAMDVVHGNLDQIRIGVANADDQAAAAKRLADITGQSSIPVPGEGMPSALDDDADEVQREAKARLYGESSQE